MGGFQNDPSRVRSAYWLICTSIILFVHDLKRVCGSTYVLASARRVANGLRDVRLSVHQLLPKIVTSSAELSLLGVLETSRNLEVSKLSLEVRTAVDLGPSRRIGFIYVRSVQERRRVKYAFTGA